MKALISILTAAMLAGCTTYKTYYLVGSPGETVVMPPRAHRLSTFENQDPDQVTPYLGLDPAFPPVAPPLPTIPVGAQ